MAVTSRMPRPFVTVAISTIAMISMSAVGYAYDASTGLGDDNGLLKYAVTQGGLLAVCLIGAWMYRRDFVSVIGRREETISALTKTLQEATAAMVTHGTSVNAVERSVDRLQVSVQHFENVMVETLRRAEAHRQAIDELERRRLSS